MPDPVPIPLTATSIDLGSEEYDEIGSWPYVDPFVARLLASDLKSRLVIGNCRVWIFRDPDKAIVGFGSLDVCDIWNQFTDGALHAYIPLLAVNPGIKSRGYGSGILQHLINEAALLARNAMICPNLFLDVYCSSEAAIKLYRKFGFESITAEPLTDPADKDKPYLIMAKNVALSEV